MKKILRPIALSLRPAIRLLLSVFFEKKYLTGRHFDVGINGCLWGLRSIWAKNILRLGRPMPWPTGLTCLVSRPENIVFHPDDLNNFQSPGLYLQNFSGKITLGRGTYIGPNVGLITSNHQALDLDSHEPGQDIVIGEKCWIGMGVVILPGVNLGPRTIVAAGAVVNKSFECGGVIVGGVPARVLKVLDHGDHSVSTKQTSGVPVP